MPGSHGARDQAQPSRTPGEHSVKRAMCLANIQCCFLFQCGHSVVMPRGFFSVFFPRRLLLKSLHLNKQFIQIHLKSYIVSGLNLWSSLSPFLYKLWDLESPFRCLDTSGSSMVCRRISAVVWMWSIPHTPICWRPDHQLCALRVVKF